MSKIIKYWTINREDGCHMISEDDFEWIERDEILTPEKLFEFSLSQLKDTCDTHITTILFEDGENVYGFDNDISRIEGQVIFVANDQKIAYLKMKRGKQEIIIPKEKIIKFLTEGYGKFII